MMGKVANAEIDMAADEGITIDVGAPAKVSPQVAIGVGAMLLGRYRIESRLGAGGTRCGAARSIAQATEGAQGGEAEGFEQGRGQAGC